MAGFTISCNNCGNKIITGDDYKSINDKISLYIDVHSTYINKALWCEQCDNSTEFDD